MLKNSLFRRNYLQSYDYIIVGSGSAGCLLANRLSSDSQNKILLIEAGQNDNYIPIHIPLGYLLCIGNKKTDWCFKTCQQDGLNERSLLYPRGKVLGGCTSINGMIYMRGQKEDYDQWARITNDEQWNWDNMLENFKKHENFYLGANDYHGNNALDVFKDAVSELGIPQKDDFNQGCNHGVGYFHVNQKNGYRLSAYRAFLHPILHNRKNLQILTGFHVDQLLFDELNPNYCAGVACYDEQKQKHEFRATKEVILSAGSVGSVQIMERSGIGNGQLLSKLGIKVKLDLPGVGENLQDHLQIRPYYQVDNLQTLNSLSNKILSQIQIGLDYLLFKRGPISMAPSQLGVFTRSDDSFETPNLQLHIQPLSLEKFGDQLHKFDAITPSVTNIRPTSRGSIHIVDKNYQSAPLINPNYLSTNADKQIAVDSIKLVRKIMLQTQAFKDYKIQEIKPGLSIQKDEELLNACKNMGTTIFHPVGTCRMGRSLKEDPMSVLNSDLQVHNISNLRIVDGSIMPNITSGNTSSPIMAISEAISKKILMKNL